MPTQRRTGLIIPVPAADRLLDAVRERHRGAVRDVPAHVSVLYPFLPAEELDDSVAASLREVFAAHRPTEVEFATCHRRPGFVGLLPEPPDVLDALAAATRRRWPSMLPYGGAFGEDPGAHLTVAMGTGEATSAEIEAEVGGWLPLRARLETAWLVVYDGAWMVHSIFPFGG
ncbi:2'-5' RNA ligase family protein [Gandjariella thermophila]|uniref:Uncharacterized protein n=1 Tax=Gandjariella thermophila TaxID=1931992 RepID=A0A4D4JGB6_9PSEU|nr:2'-5' RNA ligase family protein [Gandjariella thermophila]GDY32923.1 hypothetical protein GTS_45560 [Gandjariella thermophila]